MFGNVVGVAVDDAGWLPAQKAAHGVGAKPVDAVQVDAPLGGRRHPFSTNGTQRHTRGRVPDAILLIDAALVLPARIPVGVIGVAIAVDGQIDPIAGGSNLKFAIEIDVVPIVTQEKLDDVAVPEFQAVLAVIGGQPKI